MEAFRIQLLAVAQIWCRGSPGVSWGSRECTSSFVPALISHVIIQEWCGFVFDFPVVGSCKYRDYVNICTCWYRNQTSSNRSCCTGGSTTKTIPQFHSLHSQRRNTAQTAVWPAVIHLLSGVIIGKCCWKQQHLPYFYDNQILLIRRIGRIAWGNSCEGESYHPSQIPVRGCHRGDQQDTEWIAKRTACDCGLLWRLRAGIPPTNGASV